MKGNSLIRWTTVVAVVFAAIVAGWVSYNHAYAVVMRYGQGGIVARLYPGTVDGMIYSASMVLLDAARRSLPRPKLAMAVLIVGIIATLTSNILDGLGHGVPGALVAGWPAVALVLSYEMLMFIIRGQAADLAKAKTPAEIPADAELGPILIGVDLPAAAKATVPTANGFGGVGTPKPAKATETPAKPVSSPKAPAPSKPEPQRARHAKGAPTIEAVEREFYREIAAGQIPSKAEIQRRLKVGPTKADTYRNHIKAVGAAQREANFVPVR